MGDGIYLENNNRCTTVIITMRQRSTTWLRIFTRVKKLVAGYWSKSRGGRPGRSHSLHRRLRSTANGPNR